jgi:hypothetical protein
MSEDRSENVPITQREQQTLELLFEDDDDGESLIGLLAQASGPQHDTSSTALSDAALEALMREHFGLTNHIDLAREAAALESGSGRIDDIKDVEQDFTDEEWEIVRGLQRHCRRIVKKDTPPNTMAREVQWMFVRGTQDDSGLSFHLACQALQTRPFVVQALVQHYWGLRDIRIGTMPMLADPLPDPLYTECLYHAGVVGGDLGKRIWDAPGTPIIDAMRRASSNGAVSQTELEQAAQDLQENGLIMVNLGIAHFISRRPAFRKFRRLSWSRTFMMDD